MSCSGTGRPTCTSAFACRETPAGLGVASAVLEGRAAMLSSDDLRFSCAEVTEFFEGRLSRARLAALMSESSGWPFALRISLNAMENGEQGVRTAHELMENWIDSRLLAGLAPDDREFLLDIALLEWIDAALLDAVLERTDSLRRIRAMPAMMGLIEPVRDGAALRTLVAKQLPALPAPLGFQPHRLGATNRNQVAARDFNSHVRCQRR